MTATWVVTTKGGSASTGTSASVVSDSTTQVGDLLLVELVLRGATNGQAVTKPSGWTHLQNPATTGQPGAGQFPSASGTGTNSASWIYWFVATVAGAQTYTFSWSSGVVHVWFCDRITGQATGTPVELLGSAVASPATSTSLTTATVTTSENSELIRRYVFGSLAVGSTAMTGAGMVWDAATTKVADQQGAATSGLAWSSTAREVGGTAGSVAGRTITLPNTPISSGTIAVGVKAAGGGTTPVAPANTAVPTITTDGSPETGEAVTVAAGTWTGSPTPTYDYVWKRNGSTSGMTSNTSTSYTLVSGDEGQAITVTETATNTAGSASATSTAITPSAAAPVSSPANTVAPVITTDGTPEVGETVSCSTGTWTNSPTSYTYQWRRNGVAISGATASTYTLTVSDVGTDKIACSVTATNSGGSVTANSASISPVLSGAATRTVIRYRYT